ncbi:hypothetical protein HWV07_09775 [Natronomonas salina]|uniref:DUF7562 family protein n=1 Tax=Natronomonas salina TaxID=1710540 RepID=UPI0015B5F966|nr:hypothetical protein [Natronomonas salina]QLD89300.1 hypothetical protein HWV07_09775 [Natronomonas salina]
MWHRRDDSEVTCIACGERVSRTEAREYDKYGDRWDREDKEFEHLCKPCFRDLCHQSRTGLESLLADVETGGLSRQQFLARFVELVDEDRDSPESHERE